MNERAMYEVNLVDKEGEDVANISFDNLEEAKKVYDRMNVNFDDYILELNKYNYVSVFNKATLKIEENYVNCEQLKCKKGGINNESTKGISRKS